jgi:hypothetical protein
MRIRFAVGDEREAWHAVGAYSRVLAQPPAVAAAGWMK